MSIFVVCIRATLSAEVEALLAQSLFDDQRAYRESTGANCRHTVMQFETERIDDDEILFRFMVKREHESR